MLTAVEGITQQRKEACRILCLVIMSRHSTGYEIYCNTLGREGSRHIGAIGALRVVWTALGILGWCRLAGILKKIVAKLYIKVQIANMSVLEGN